MIWLALALWRVLADLDPAAATRLAATIEGAPELAPELLAICKRESSCRRVGVHVNDVPFAVSMYSAARSAKWLDPETCPFHRGNPERFGVRGVHGLSAAYSMRFLPCLPPEALDLPIVSALAAVRRMKNLCAKFGACTKQARRRFWAGAYRGKVRA